MHQKKQSDQELLLQASGSSDSEELNSSSIVEMKDNNGDPVIMDLNPKKFEKSKDNLFFDFFSIYTKNLILEKEKKKNERRRF